MHSSICETYSVQWCFIDLWSMEGDGYICPGYMCILLYVTLVQFSGVPWIYGQLEEGVCLPLVYLHSFIC